ncbi:6449_t:CDS:2 [Paraglomus brasilianum]|uniref:6449_t:CDS:1 n=1 Tax=Paraglomus brasilianum TaxID=144538 RepID=A0A9N9GEJ7_9GLOM|nr:6449_t:CDS:2 [Paraglomus brasilianum]
MSRHTLFQLGKLLSIRLRPHILNVTRPIDTCICISRTHPTFQNSVFYRPYSSKKDKKGNKKQKHSKPIDDLDEPEDDNPRKSGKKKDSASDALDFDVETLEDKMKDIIERLKKDYSTMRAGRANPALLDSIVVPHSTGKTPLKDLAQVIVKDPQNLIVTVQDNSLLTAIDKAIRTSELNLNPLEDTKGLRVPIPKHKLVNIAKKNAEHARQKIRHVRQEGLKDLKKDVRDGLPVDDGNKLTKKFQVIVDKYTKDIDDILKAKTKEIQNS